MKKYFSLSAIALVAFLAGCEKSARITPPHQLIDTDQVIFSTKGFGYDVSTKVTAVTELNSFNVLACTGSAGSQANYWGEVVTATKSGDDYLTSKYWASTDPSITSFYASNAALTFNAAGPTVAPDGTVDVVCAHLSSPTYKVKNTLTFDHIYARVGTITLNTQTGYELSAVSATLKDRVSGGTYNLRLGAGHTDGTGWTPGAGSDAAAAAFSGSTSAQTSTNDLYVVPGSYSLQISYTLTKGSYVQSFTKSGSISLVAGKTNNITATAIGGAAAEIKFGVSVTPWSANAIVMEFAPTFGGLEISSGPLYYNGTGYEIKDSWNNDSYNSVYGKNSGSTYFSFIEMGQLFEKAGFSTSDGDIENLLDPLSGWRLPTQTEWAAIVGTSRAGSTVNGNAGKHYALIQLTGVTHAGSSIPNGLLIFPDGKSITGKNLSGMDNTTQTTGVTESELNAFLAQGCVFLPASGHYFDGDGWYNGGAYGFYWSSTEYLSSSAYYMYFGGSRLNTGRYDDKVNYYISVRLVRE